jgi:hypothetical protein
MTRKNKQPSKVKIAFNVIARAYWTFFYKLPGSGSCRFGCFPGNRGLVDFGFYIADPGGYPKQKTGHLFIKRPIGIVYEETD